MISINLVFTDAKKIRELNRKYRGIDKVTSILTFYYGPYFVPPTGGTSRGKQAGVPLGEIIICLSEAKKQGISIEKLVIHGIKSLLSEIPTTKNLRT
ncbi:rRNA maturation RNase YbeY [Candidatus Shapirobacteria bacterium CG_4_9_14_0_2_um_filter_39_11]|uniref:rRNA maturation RNase YbeY n=1 Tax=Candidatus Shapirobacteria bacterium CG_4_9_14_0_2_um_filter_39_11 TaxID=1974478 RepID=A0A2M8ETF7_9BACT|nr:MAG: rRNA maturation RNase YbeY [Candidatus Shapirobacteria bacterium CG_4_9_14_0_2_um_filter_39_11]